METQPMDGKERMDELDVFEKRVLRALAEMKRGDVQSLSRSSRLNEDQVRKAAQELKEKNLASVSTTTREFISLGEKGEQLAKIGLPERLIIERLLPISGPTELSMLRDEVSLNEEDFSAGLGKAMKNGWIRLWRKGETTLIETTDKAGEKSVEEELVYLLLAKGEMLEEGLSSKQKKALEKLMKRPGFIRTTSLKLEVVEVTNKGERRAKSVQSVCKWGN